MSAIDFYKGQPIETNADYGFRQLAEVAIKAVSPGINDPATAVTSLHALSDLFAYRLHCHPRLVIYGEDDMARIEVKVSTFSEIFDECIQPIWNYGKSDQYIQKQLSFMIDQLKKADHEKNISICLIHYHIKYINKQQKLTIDILFKTPILLPVNLQRKKNNNKFICVL